MNNKRTVFDLGLDFVRIPSQAEKGSDLSCKITKIHETDPIGRGLATIWIFFSQYKAKSFHNIVIYGTNILTVSPAELFRILISSERI